MTTTTKTILTHKWQENGIGFAPFRVVGLISLPPSSLAEDNNYAYQSMMHAAHQQANEFGVVLGSCQVCSNGIMNNYVVRDANGKKFVVGCDCVAKTDDSKMEDEVKVINRKVKAELRQAAWGEKMAKISQKANNEAERQRSVNGGLTDAEIAKAAADAKAAANAAQFDWLLSVLDGNGSEFAFSIADEIRRGRNPSAFSDRCLSIIADIYCKSFGRSGSKANVKASEEFDSRISVK
jgi:hypothetical protein